MSRVLESVVILLLAVLFSGCDSTPEYTPAEFEEIVLGKTREEVIAAVGRPDNVVTLGDTFVS